MKKLFLGIILSVIATAATAACFSKTYYVNGKVILCTVCCDENRNCVETCS